MADNITILDSTGASKAWGTSEGADSQHRQHVVVTDGDGAQGTITAATGTTHDAASAGDPRLMAGVYDDTNTDEVDEGDAGTVRITVDRAMLAAGLHRSGGGNYSAISRVAGIGFSTTWSSGYADLSTASLAFATFVNPTYYRIPMVHLERGLVGFWNSSGADVTLSLYGWFVQGVGVTGDGAGGTAAILDTVLVSSGTTVLFSPFSGGAAAGANYRAVPALQLPMSYLIVKAAGTPISGGYGIFYAAG